MRSLLLSLNTYSQGVHIHREEHCYFSYLPSFQIGFHSKWNEFAPVCTDSLGSGKFFPSDNYSIWKLLRCPGKRT